MKKRSRTGCILGILIAGAAFVLVLVALLAVGIQAYQDTPRQVAGFDFNEPVPEAYQLSGQQIELIQRDGYPQRFSILFYSDRDVNGEFETIRFEEWAYPTIGRSYVFENGALISESEIPLEAVAGTVYRPEAFTDFINRKQVSAAAGLDEWMIVPVEKELVEDADLYYAEGLTFGLRGGDLVFIEALGFESVQASSIRREVHPAAKSARSLTPVRSVETEYDLYHSMDNALLLMISSQMRVSGEVTSAHLPGAGLVMMPAPQTGDTSEVDVLIDLYEAQVQKLRDSDEFDLGLEDRLITDLEDKLVTLNAKAQALKAQRSKPRHRGGLAGILKRGVKALGRGAGWLMGQAMDGAGKIAEFAIEDVAPQVLKEAIQGGSPLTAALVRQVARKLLINRIGDAIYLQQYRRANRLANSDDDFDPVADATFEADLMEAFEEGEEDDSPSLGAGIDDPVPTAGGIGEGSSGGSGITEKRPVRFTNNGFETATVVVETYTPAEGLSASLPTASTVVSPDSNSSAYLELPLGTYTFCYYWQLDQDSNNDGYFDYHHRTTSNHTLNINSSQNVNNAQTVTITPESNISNPNGKCGEVVAQGTSGQTPSEIANSGTHQWLATCIDMGNEGEYCDGESFLTTATITFSNGTAYVEDEYSSWNLTKVGLNTYSWIDNNGLEFYYIFHLEGFTLSASNSGGKIEYALQD